MTKESAGAWPHLSGKTATFITLGCKVNSYETEAMAQQLEAAGVKVVPEEASRGISADICVVNTCSVTNIADRKSRQMMRRARKSFPGCVVVGVGCYVQAVGEKVQEEGLADLLIGTNLKNGLTALLEEYYCNQENSEKENVRGRISTDQGTVLADPETCSTGILLIDLKKRIPYEKQHITLTMEHTRAYVKIQDGCNLFCTYCIIPYTRGRIRSRQTEDILSEVRDLAESGIREVVLTGIHISSYGMEWETDNEAKKHFSDGKYLLELLRALDEIPGITRIRTGSFEPRVITPAFVEGLKGIKKLCPHFHLSMQSGSDAVLKRMNRHYDTTEYEAGCKLLRQAFPDVALTTDVIVGFPGETEQEFAETVEFCKRIGFYEMHVFQYSRRAGTVADKMPDQVPEPVKKERSEVLLDLTAVSSGDYRARLLESGNAEELLLEHPQVIDGKEYLTGYDKHYVRMALPVREGICPGTAVKVRPVSFVSQERDCLFVEEVLADSGKMV